MIRNFSELVERVKSLPKKTIAVAVPEAKEIIQALERAHCEGLVEIALAGNAEEIERLRKQEGARFPIKHLVDAREEQAAADAAVRMVAEGKAHMVMKGNLHTSAIVSALLNKSFGQRTERAISHIFILESKPCGRLLFVSDSAVNIAPDLERKRQILQNAIDFVRKLGCAEPKAAVLAAVEYVNEKMPVTVEAAQLAAMALDGRLTGAKVGGPLALDDALSPWVCREKKVEGPVQGDADILLVPNIEAGNILSKAQTFIAGGPLAGVAVGAKIPLVLNSRADSQDNRFYAIAAASLAA